MALQPSSYKQRRDVAAEGGPLRRPMAGVGALARHAHGGSHAVSTVPENESRLTVGPHIRLKSVEITSCDTLLIDGAVEATMDLRVMQINERGSFTGTAEVDNAEIRGQFDGVLLVRETLVIHATGRVSGSIRYGRIVIEEGGQLTGDIEIGALPGAAATAPATVLQAVAAS